MDVNINNGLQNNPEMTSTAPLRKVLPNDAQLFSNVIQRKTSGSKHVVDEVVIDYIHCLLYVHASFSVIAAAWRL